MRRAHSLTAPPRIAPVIEIYLRAHPRAPRDFEILPRSWFADSWRIPLMEVRILYGLGARKREREKKKIEWASFGTRNVPPWWEIWKKVKTSTHVRVLLGSASVDFDRLLTCNKKRGLLIRQNYKNAIRKGSSIDSKSSSIKRAIQNRAIHYLHIPNL